MTNGERIKYLREKNGFTQKEIATRLGVEPATISKYELDMREPNIEAIIKLATIFDVSIDYLLGRKDKYNFTKKKTNKLREDILVRIKDQEYDYNLYYYFTIGDNQKVLEEIEKIFQDREYVAKYRIPYFDDIKIKYNLDFNLFCNDVYIKMGRPSIYIYKIEEIKNNPKTKEDYIKYIKERRDKKIKSLKKFLKENEDSFEEEQQELQYLKEKIEELERRARKIKSKYSEILIP